MDIKYAYIVIPSTIFFPNQGLPFSFDKETVLERGSIKPNVNTIDAQHWSKWLGSTLWEHLQEDDKLLLSTWMATKNPKVVDAENQSLEQKILTILRVLPVIAPLLPPFEDCYLMSGWGTLVNSQIKVTEIRSFSKVNTWTRSMYSEGKRDATGYSALWHEFYEWATQDSPSWDLLKRWKNFYDTFDKLFLKQKTNRQIFEAFRSFEEAIRKTHQMEFKIPNLVRSLECLIDCYGAKDFSKLVTYLLGNPPSSLPFKVSSNTSSLLEHLYQLRNDCSHGKTFGYSFEKHFKRAITEYDVATFEFLSEWYVRKLLNNALYNSTILQNSSDRDTLVMAWKNCLIKP